VTTSKRPKIWRNFYRYEKQNRFAKINLDILVGLEEIGINRTLHFVEIASHRIVKGMEPGSVVDRGHGASLQ